MKQLLIILLLLTGIYAQKIKIKYSPNKYNLYVNDEKLAENTPVDLPEGTYRVTLLYEGNLRLSEYITVDNTGKKRTLRYRVNTKEKRIKEMIASVGIQFPLSKWGRLGQLGTVDFGILFRNDFYWGLYCEAPTPGGLLVGLKEKQRTPKLRTAIGGSFGALFNEMSIDADHTTTKWVGIESRFIIGTKQRFMLRAALMYGDVDFDYDAVNRDTHPSNLFPSLSMAITFRKKRGYKGVVGPL